MIKRGKMPTCIFTVIFIFLPTKYLYVVQAYIHILCLLHIFLTKQIFTTNCNCKFINYVCRYVYMHLCCLRIENMYYENVLELEPLCQCISFAKGGSPGVKVFKLMKIIRMVVNMVLTLVRFCVKVCQH